MAECQICNKKYHACGSCGLENWEYSYCSKQCLNVYQEKALPVLLKKYGLSREQLKKLLEESCDLYLDSGNWCST